MLWSVFALALLFMFRKDLHVFADAVRTALSDFSLTFTASAIQTKFDAHQELLDLAKKHGIKVPAGASTEELVKLLRK